MDAIKEFFRWTTNREPEGFLSWQHIAFVTLCVAAAVLAAVFLSKKHGGNRAAEDRTLKRAALLMLGLELIKYFVICLRSGSISAIRGMLPLFLCSINIFTLLIAAFCHGYIRNLAIDFLFIYGEICCLGGTYLASNYFSGSPVLSFDPMCSVFTHCIQGFAGLYVFLTHQVTMKRSTAYPSLIILLAAELMAYAANLWNAPYNGVYEYNYMFLMNSAGTPFEIVYNLVGQNSAVYTFAVALLYHLWGVLFISVYRRISFGRATGRN